MNRRVGWFAAAFALAALACSTIAPAAVQNSTGIRYVITSGTKADCGAKAQQALNAFLENAAESAPGSGEWMAVGPPGSAALTATGVVTCFGLPQGYAVNFTCIVQTPDNPYSADDLCLNIAHAFSGKPTKALATPPPAPTGCTTANLVGTWTSNNKPGLTLTFSTDGSLLDSDGVSGNWALYNTAATLTYYGTHSLTLSADGKHLRGEGYDLTRKC